MIKRCNYHYGERSRLLVFASSSLSLHRITALMLPAKMRRSHAVMCAGCQPIFEGMRSWNHRLVELVLNNWL